MRRCLRAACPPRHGASFRPFARRPLGLRNRAHDERGARGARAGRGAFSRRESRFSPAVGGRARVAGARRGCRTSGATTAACVRASACAPWASRNGPRTTGIRRTSVRRGTRHRGWTAMRSGSTAVASSLQRCRAMRRSSTRLPPAASLGPPSVGCASHAMPDSSPLIGARTDDCSSVARAFSDVSEPLRASRRAPMALDRIARSVRRRGPHVPRLTRRSGSD